MKFTATERTEAVGDIYLTVEQIEQLYALTTRGKRPVFGVQLTGDAKARSTVALGAVLVDASGVLIDATHTTVIESDGACPGWSL